MRALILALLAACSSSTPQTRTELCQEIQKLTCHIEYQDCNGPITPQVCDQGGFGGVYWETCCTAINCESAREVTGAEAEACLDAAAEGYTCERIDQGWVPAACRG